MDLLKFNLLTEPWIPAVSPSSIMKEYGIVDLLKQAHELRAIVDAAPTHQFGMYRFLIVFVVDALHISSVADVVAALEVGKFGLEIDDYAEMHANRFDLLDETHPFMQVSKLSLNASGFTDEDIGFIEEYSGKSRGKKKSYAEEASILFDIFPHGINRLLLDVDIPSTYSCGECAKALCSISPFAMSGGKGKGKGECASVGKSPSINGAPPWYTLAIGSNLFETILFNARGIAKLCESGRQLGVPLWRMDDRVQLNVIESAKKGKDKKGKSREGASILEGMTWPARVVHLLPMKEGHTVERVFLNTGLKLEGAGSAKAFKGWQDPSVAYNKKKPITPFLGAWLDIGQFISGVPEVKRKKNIINTPSVTWDLDGIVDFELYGVRTKQDKILYWKVEKLRVPKLGPDDFESVMKSANIIHAGIYDVLRDNHKTIAGLIEEIRVSFWRVVQEAIAGGDMMSMEDLVEGCCAAMQSVMPTCQVASSTQKLKNYVESVTKNDAE